MSTHRSRHSLPIRLGGLWLAILFLLSGAREGIAGYECSQHGGHDHGAMVEALASAEAPADSHAQHHGASISEDAADPSGAAPQPCDCIGDCLTGQSVAPTTQVATAFAPRVQSVAALHSHLEVWLPATPDHFLPWANAPPLS